MKTLQEFKTRVNKFNSIRGLQTKDSVEVVGVLPEQFTIKAANYGDYCNAYVKALFFNNEKEILFFERPAPKENNKGRPFNFVGARAKTSVDKQYLKPEDKLIFKELTSNLTFDARKKYFSDRTSKLNATLKLFIDKNERYEMLLETGSNPPETRYF